MFPCNICKYHVPFGDNWGNPSVYFFNSKNFFSFQKQMGSVNFPWDKVRKKLHFLTTFWRWRWDHDKLRSTSKGTLSKLWKSMQLCCRKTWMVALLEKLTLGGQYYSLSMPYKSAIFWTFLGHDNLPLQTLKRVDVIL